MGRAKQALHEAFADAVQAGLVFRLDGGYRFPHDRIQQAAYALLPETARANVHLRMGRRLLAALTGDDRAAHLFEIANQFNRGAALLADRHEKIRVAEINLRAGRKAKASAAYASAGAYFSAGMALLEESDWGREYALTFGLWLERAACALLTGDFATTELLLAELLRRGASKINLAAVVPVADPAPYGEVGKPTGRGQRAHLPAPVRHRHLGLSAPGTGSGRI